MFIGLRPQHLRSPALSQQVTARIVGDLPSAVLEKWRATGAVVQGSGVQGISVQDRGVHSTRQNQVFCSKAAPLRILSPSPPLPPKLQAIRQPEP